MNLKHHTIKKAMLGNIPLNMAFYETLEKRPLLSSLKN